jgi:putative membrane protein
MGHGMMGNMFNSGYNSAGSFIWWFMLGHGLLSILIIGGIIFMVYKINNGNRKQQDGSNAAIKILKERFATGEIDEDEYKKKLKFLKS